MTATFLSAAIDFGTTFSSWAFSFRHQYKQEPTRVTTKRWKGSGNSISLKAPTCILICPDGKTLDSFGYHAEKKYASLSESEEHKDWFMFQRFKMQLYGQQVDRHLQLSDVTGKKLPAVTVFALSIRYLKDDLMETVRRGLITEGKGLNDADEKHEDPENKEQATKKGESVDPNVIEKDIQWVITVPAIWDDAAKQFMREAAQEAGIPTENLTIGLEPEAASIYSRSLPAVDCKGSLQGLQPGSKYMILDAGGGTVDITIHEVEDSGKLKEKHKASGGDWGGTRVDQEYHKLVETVFGTNIMEEFKQKCMEDYLQMTSDCEVKKRLSKPELGQKVTVRIPASFRDLLETHYHQTPKEAVQSSQYKDKLSLSGDKLRIDFDLFRSLFEYPLQEITQHVSKILEHPDADGCGSILMVGGFSDSIILQNAMEDAFPGKNIIVPGEPELCIIKGAVIFGHDPTIITERRLKYTYGVAVVHEKSDACTHPPCETKEILGEEHCVNIFSIHVHAGQVVKVNEQQTEESYCSPNPFADTMEVQIYFSTEENPIFVTDESCKCIGKLRVPVTPIFLGVLLGDMENVGINVTFMFGGTEIKVKGIDKKTMNEVNVKLDCLGEM